MKHSIVILIPHFGGWPPWMNFFVESCRGNGDIDWILFSDAVPPENRAPNLRFIRTSFAEYKALVSRSLGIAFDPEAPYKLCDLKPALGYIHRDLIARYDFFGFGDLDLVYGRIRDIYDRETLDIYDALSTHPERVSGHLFLMRNREELVTGFMRLPGWRRRLEAPDYEGFDEQDFYTLFRGRKARLLSWLGREGPRCLFREAYTTPAATQHMRWYWRDGRLSNEFYPHRSFIYLHFMSWHSSRWYAHHPHIAPGTPAPWKRLAEIVQIDWREARRSGFMISPGGIGRIEPPAYPG